MTTGYDIPETPDEPGTHGEDGHPVDPPIEDQEGAEPFDLGGVSEEDAEALKKVMEELAKHQLPSEAITGFVCMLSKNGVWIGSSRLELLPYITFDREAGFTDMISGTHAVGVDALAARGNESLGAVLSQLPQVTAAFTLQGMEAQAKKFAEEANAKQILKKVQQSGGLKVPGQS